MTISRSSFPIVDHDRRATTRSALDALERQLIDRALTRAQGNRTAAASLLGLDSTPPALAPRLD